MILEQRYFIELAFKGTAYNGWQIQPNAVGIQQVIEQNLEILTKEKVRVTGAGRTDTGVHASYFVAHFTLKSPLQEPGTTATRLNHMLPGDIAVLNLFPVGMDDHSRFSALSRTYKYFIAVGKNPFRQETSLHMHFLPDIDMMNLAAAELFNYDDFRSFCRSNSGVTTYTCRIMEAGWQIADGMLVFTIKSDRFLRNMVRAITGTLLDVGRRKTSVGQFRSIIESKDRRRAGKSAPANGLFLTDIEYPERIPVRKNKPSF